jgi:putative transposase
MAGADEPQIKRATHANIHNHFNLEHHLIDQQTFKERRSAALAEWQTVAS